MVEEHEDGEGRRGDDDDDDDMRMERGGERMMMMLLKGRKKERRGRLDNTLGNPLFYCLPIAKTGVI